jgi:hypothetical protein
MFERDINCHTPRLLCNTQLSDADSFCHRIGCPYDLINSRAGYRSEVVADPITADFATLDSGGKLKRGQSLLYLIRLLI